MRAHHAGQRTLIGDGESGVPEFRRLRDQLFRVRGAPQEAEFAEAMQLRVVGSFGAHLRFSITPTPSTKYPVQKPFPGARTFTVNPVTRATRITRHVVVTPCVGVIPPAAFDALWAGQHFKCPAATRPPALRIELLRRMQQPQRP